MKRNKTGFSNNSSRSMSSPSFNEFGQPPFPRSVTLSRSGPLNYGTCISRSPLAPFVEILCAQGLFTGLGAGKKAEISFLRTRYILSIYLQELSYGETWFPRAFVHLCSPSGNTHKFPRFQNAARVAKNIERIINKIASIWRGTMLKYLSLDIICSEFTVFLEPRSRNFCSGFSERIMVGDKYPRIFRGRMLRLYNI